MPVVEALSATEPQERWHAATEDSQLEAFEGRAELDAYGEISMTPPPWLSGERAAAMTTPAAERPEIVVEVDSPRNTKAGLRSKAARFLAHGAQKVVLVELSGAIRFITPAGESDQSRFGLRLTLPPNTYPQ